MKISEQTGEHSCQFTALSLKVKKRLSSTTCDCFVLRCFTQYGISVLSGYK